jgi:hypothetical protein
LRNTSSVAATWFGGRLVATPFPVLARFGGISTTRTPPRTSILVVTPVPCANGSLFADCNVPLGRYRNISANRAFKHPLHLVLDVSPVRSLYHALNARQVEAVIATQCYNHVLIVRFAWFFGLAECIRAYWAVGVVPGSVSTAFGRGVVFSVRIKLTSLLPFSTAAAAGVGRATVERGIIPAHTDIVQTTSCLYTLQQFSVNGRDSIRVCVV